MVDDTDREQDGVEKESARMIVTRQDEGWVFAAEYLELLKYTGAIHDGEFNSLFDKLLDYVYDKIKLPDDGGNIVDSCYMIWQKPKDDKKP